MANSRGGSVWNSLLGKARKRSKKDRNMSEWLARTETVTMSKSTRLVMDYEPMNKKRKSWVHTGGFLLSYWINWKFDEEWDIYIVSEYLPTKILINYTEEKSDFTAANAGRGHLNPMMQLTIINDGTKWNYIPLNEKPWEDSITASAALCQRRQTR